MINENRIIGLSCGNCGAMYPFNGQQQSVCPDCDPVYGTLECRFNYDSVRKIMQMRPFETRRDMSMFRYQEFLPVLDPNAHVPLHIGWTPLYESVYAAEKLGVRTVLIKDDSHNPTASYKDRASAIAVARARELNYDAICTASTGNAAASLAACCRSVHYPCVLLVPAKTPSAKLLQMLGFGAIVIRVDGSYEDAFHLAAEACNEFGWMNRSAGYNPYLVEGKKTGALELAEQTAFKLPDHVLVPVGDGSIITGICKGFKELVQLGCIPSCPRVIGVQAAGANALFRAWKHHKTTGILSIEAGRNPHTIADSISVGFPREGIRALQSVSETNGFFIEVNDQEITEAMRRMPLETAVFGEPAAAAAYAGLIRLARAGSIGKESSVAVFVTGSALKDPSTAENIWLRDLPEPVAPGRDALRLIRKKVEENEKRPS